MVLPRQLSSMNRRVNFHAIQKRLVSQFQVLPEVRRALDEGRPVVALESTIVAHGMAYPQNLELSQRLAAILRERGVEPATIALHKGKVKVGLHTDELQELAEGGSAAMKCTTRQMGLFLSDPNKVSPAWGATTVASTMVLAHKAGIETFVTGGIGGVHRGGETSLDISADLLELSRTPVVVVSAGIKSILDISRTLEVLETYSVPVVAYQSDEFPAFFSPHSGAEASTRCDTTEQIAAAFRYNRDFLNLQSGMLVGVPNSDPAGEAVESAIQQALQEATQQEISGPAVTPFILKRVAELTSGESLQSNMALVENNAIIGADIAIELSSRQASNKVYQAVDSARSFPSRVIVMGGCVLDIVAKPADALILGTSNVTETVECDGGVGRNIAEALGRLGSKPVLYTAIGDDVRGKALLDRLRQNNSDCMLSPIRSVDRTATYLAVLDDAGDMHVGCADMDVMQNVSALDRKALENAEFLIVDSNPSLEVLRETAQLACEMSVKVLWEPTSVPKALELAPDTGFFSSLAYITPNLDEFFAIAALDDSKANINSVLSGSEQQREITGSFKSHLKAVLDRMSDLACVVVTLGPHGVVAAWASSRSTTEFLHVAAKELAVQNATGAGDSFTGAFVHSQLQGASMEESVRFGMRASELTLQCRTAAVSPRLNDLVDSASD